LVGDHYAAERAYKLGIRLSKSQETLYVDLAILQETHLKNRASAAKTWMGYLKLAPKGTAAPRAHLALAMWALSWEKVAQAKVHFWTILGEFPNSMESGAAVTWLGGQLLREERWADAETFFLEHENGTGAKAEAALVGLMRVDIAQGRREAAVERMRLFEKRFPDGNRDQEVQRLKDALNEAP